MQKLVSGIHEFQDTVFSSQQQLYRSLANGQNPLALFITCSDSRICPNLLTQTDPGELFILRNAGNLVPPHGAGQGGEAATIEYAVSVLHVSDVIICGHSHCGVMAAMLDPALAEDLPAVKNWLNQAEATRRIIDENYGHIPAGPARQMAAIEENVLVQLENLKTHPSVAAAIARRELKLHGWVYKFETGQVFSFCPQREQFVPVGEVEVAPSPALAAAR